jgi:hypothetical protein
MGFGRLQDEFGQVNGSALANFYERIDDFGRLKKETLNKSEDDADEDVSCDSLQPVGVDNYVCALYRCTLPGAR